MQQSRVFLSQGPDILKFSNTKTPVLTIVELYHIFVRSFVGVKEIQVTLSLFIRESKTTEVHTKPNKKCQSQLLNNF